MIFFLHSYPHVPYFGRNALVPPPSILLGGMWLAIKNLYTGIRAQVLYSDSLSKTFDISQSTGQGKKIALFMYKVYINGLLRTLTQHSFVLSINSLRLTSPSFADDISPLALYLTFLLTFMNICHKYRIKR